jgi:hypothetical protein
VRIRPGRVSGVGKGEGKGTLKTLRGEKRTWFVWTLRKSHTLLDWKGILSPGILTRDGRLVSLRCGKLIEKVSNLTDHER